MKALTSLSRYAVASLLVVTLLCVAAGAREELTEEAAKQLRTQVEACGRSFIEGNFERLAECTYPKLVELLGGREKMVAAVRKDVEAGKTEGFEPLSVAYSAPTQVLRVGARIYAVVPAKLKVRTTSEILVSDSFMLGITDDDGKSWKFLGGDSADEARMKILLPEAVGKLKLPTAKYSTEPLPAKP